MIHKFSNTKRQRENALTKKSQAIIDKRISQAKEQEIDYWFVRLPLNEKREIVAIYAGFLLAKRIWKGLEELIPNLKPIKTI